MAEPLIERIAVSLRDRIAAIHTDRLPAIIQGWTTEVNGAVDDGLAGQLAPSVCVQRVSSREDSSAFVTRS